MWFRKKKPLARWALEAPLLEWSEGAVWDLRAAYAGLICLGGIGAGKSSSTMRVVSTSLLKMGAGGLFCTVKPEDTQDYISYVKAAGRLSDLRVVSLEDLPWRYNFIAAEQAACPDPVMLAENVTALLMTLAEIGQGDGGGGGGGDNEKFFKLESMRLCRNALLVLILSRQALTIQNLHQMIVSSPQSMKQAQDPEFQEGSFLYQCLKEADETPKKASLAADAGMAISFFMLEWPGLSPRTRSVVQTVLTSTTDQLSRGVARDLLSSTDPNMSPTDTYDGKIYIIDAPVLKYREVGKIIQVTLKYCFQRAHARRDVSKNNRPTFIIADEYQMVAVEEDNAFQGIARSTRTACCYSTQSVSGLLEALGGNSAEPRVMSLLSNLQTKVVHQSTDHRVVQWFQNMVGKSARLSMSGNRSSSGGNALGSLFGEDDTSSAGFSEQIDFELQASDFNTLANGGPHNHWHAEALIYQGGQRFNNGKTWLRAAIPQKG